MSKVANNDIAEKYQQKTDKEHILDNPDTYIGSVENVDSELYLFENETNKQLFRSPLSQRNYQSCCLALSPIHIELSGY